MRNNIFKILILVMLFGCTETDENKTFTTSVVNLVFENVYSNSIELKWDHLEGAKGYYIYYSYEGSSFILAGESNKNNFIHKNLYSDCKYTYKVRGFNNKFESTFSKEIEIETLELQDNEEVDTSKINEDLKINYVNIEKEFIKKGEQLEIEVSISNKGNRKYYIKPEFKSVINYLNFGETKVISSYPNSTIVIKTYIECSNTIDLTMGDISKNDTIYVSVLAKINESYIRSDPLAYQLLVVNEDKAIISIEKLEIINDEIEQGGFNNLIKINVKNQTVHSYKVSNIEFKFYNEVNESVNEYFEISESENLTLFPASLGIINSYFKIAPNAPLGKVFVDVNISGTFDAEYAKGGDNGSKEIDFFFVVKPIEN